MFTAGTTVGDHTTYMIQKSGPQTYMYMERTSVLYI